MNKIDINKKYRTRSGCEVEYLHRAPEGWPTDYPWRGVVKGSQCTWTDEGRSVNAELLRDYDLIEVPELEFDWSCLPAWADAMTWAGSQGWMWWQKQPALEESAWVDLFGGLRGYIPSDFLPRYNGSDPAPIFKRPSKEGGEA